MKFDLEQMRRDLDAGLLCPTLWVDGTYHAVMLAEIERLTALVEAADALNEVAKTGRDYVSDIAGGHTWSESQKDGQKALVLICVDMAKEDLDRFDAALTAYRKLRGACQ